MKKEPIIYLSAEVAEKLKHYTDIAKGEVSAMGKSVYDKDTGDVTIVDIQLLKQKCSSATTEIDQQSMSVHLTELVKKGEDPKDWNVWLHTHADFGVFWSSTDENCISIAASTSPYLISVVTNKKGEYKGRIDTFPKDTSPFKMDAQNTKDCKVINYVFEDKLDEISDKQDDITKRKELLEKEIEKEEEKIEKIKKKVKKLDDKYNSLEYYDDKEVKEACEKEMKEKVTENSHSKYKWNKTKPLGFNTELGSYKSRDNEGKPWGEDDIVSLRYYVDAGYSVLECADLLERYYISTKNKIDELFKK